MAGAVQLVAEPGAAAAAQAVPVEAVEQPDAVSVGLLVEALEAAVPFAQRALADIAAPVAAGQRHLWVAAGRILSQA